MIFNAFLVRTWVTQEMRKTAFIKLLHFKKLKRNEHESHESVKMEIRITFLTIPLRLSLSLPSATMRFRTQFLSKSFLIYLVFFGNIYFNSKNSRMYLQLLKRKKKGMLLICGIS